MCGLLPSPPSRDAEKDILNFLLDAGVETKKIKEFKLLSKQFKVTGILKAGDGYGFNNEGEHVYMYGVYKYKIDYEERTVAGVVEEITEDYGDCNLGRIKTRVATNFTWLF